LIIFIEVLIEIGDTAFWSKFIRFRQRWLLLWNWMCILGTISSNCDACCYSVS